jgi:hypothetical protein
MTDPTANQPGLSVEELEHEQIVDLPERQAMTLIPPGALPHLPLPPIELPDEAAAAIEAHQPSVDLDSLPPELVTPTAPPAMPDDIS